jgi:hypothetical protein
MGEGRYHKGLVDDSNQKNWSRFCRIRHLPTPDLHNKTMSEIILGGCICFLSTIGLVHTYVYLRCFEGGGRPHHDFALYLLCYTLKALTQTTQQVDDLIKAFRGADCVWHIAGN